MGIKEKTINGLAWNFTGNVFNQGITFLIGIILARLLTPHEYGLIATVTIFTMLIQPFVNSGFSQALIRKQNCGQEEFSTVFFFNLFMGLVFYLILFFAANSISSFFKEPQLITIIRVLGVIVILDAAALIQSTLLTKNVDFEIQTKISVIANIVSGTIGILTAFMDFKVWSLVYREISLHLITSALLWLNNKWKPVKVFNVSVLKELFGFSSKLLASAILDKVYYNIYNLVIARFFSARELGLFTRAKMFKDLGSEHLTEIVSKVAFPVFSSIQSDSDTLKKHYIEIRNCTMFIVFPLMFGLCGIAESLVLTLIGEQWRDSIIYLQLLSFVGLFYPMITFTRDLLFVYGKSGLFFRLNIFAKALAVPAILIGIISGINYMIIALIIAGLLEFLVKAYYSGKLVNYTVTNQIKDLLPGLILGITIGISLLMIEMLLSTSPILTLLIQIIVGLILFLGISETFRIKEYLIIRNIAFNRIHNRG